MPNLLNDPTFVNRAAQWQNMWDATTAAGYVDELWSVTDGTATITQDAYGSYATGVLGSAGAPTAGANLTASVMVSAASAVTVAVLQDGAVLGSTTQAAATATLAEVTVTAVADSASTLTLRVTPAVGTDTLRLASPAITTPGTDPGPDPDPDAPAALAADLAPRVAAYLGSDTYEAQAEASLPVVIEFVKGYVRDRGFGVDGYSPEPGLRAVIVSAASRLVANPEQVASYQASDYSERPAVFTGYTLAEIGVLHRYRRRAW